MECSQVLRHQLSPVIIRVSGLWSGLYFRRLSENAPFVQRGSATEWSLAIGTIGSHNDPVIPQSTHMSPTEATNLQWHPYMQCTDAQTPKHIHCSALNTCSQWNAHRRQSDFIRETYRVSSWPPKYTVCAYNVDMHCLCWFADNYRIHDGY